MLELSKLESNEFKLKRDRVELGRVVPIVLALFRERAEKKGVRLGSDLLPKHTAVEGDARALEHVLSNLVDNAVKYCPSGTKVVVSASEEDDRVRLVVTDSGPGIPAEHLPRVFERFYRQPMRCRSCATSGTGLGTFDRQTHGRSDAWAGGCRERSRPGVDLHRVLAACDGPATVRLNVTKSSRTGAGIVTVQHDPRRA